MNCSNITTGYCGSLCHNNSGGIAEIFVTNKSNIDAITYYADESIADITLNHNTHWYYVVPNVESSNWVETVVSEESNNVLYYEQTITVVLGSTQQALRNFIESTASLPLAFIILDDNGRYFYFDDSRLDSGEIGSGTSWSDLNGATLEYYSRSKEPIFEADVEHSTNLKQDLEDAKNPNPPVQPEHYIHYVSSVPLSGVWIDTNTDSRFNTWDDSTGDGYVYIYDGVTTIGGSNSDDYSPFHNNSNVTLIDITNTEFTTIGDFAFRGCSNLTDFAYNENITSFGNYCFYQCESIPNFEFSDNVESIGQYAFYGCSDLADVSIGTGIENISSDAFTYTALTSFDVPSTITTISPYLLRGTPITSITIPDNILSVGRYAFADCSLLTTATIGNGVENIHASAFENCTSLQNLTIGDSVEMISNSAFEDCSTLDELTLPDTLAIIAPNTFYGCNSLMDVYIERDTPPSLANNNFTAIGDTLHVPYSLLDTYENNTAWRNAFTFIRPDGYSYVNVVAGENGSTSGSGWYLIGSTITISATADSHYHFTAWNDGDTNATRSITVGSSDVTFTASFAIDRFLLNVGVNDSSYGSVSGTGYYDYGTQVTISATPNEHYHFTQWQDGDVTNPRTVTVTSNMTFVATLAIDTFVLTVNTDSSNGTASGSGTYNYGTQVQIEATPNEHYHFTAWNDGVATNPRTVTVTADATYTASIAIDRFLLHVGVNDSSYGTVTGTGYYDYGTQVTISAIPNEHYHFSQWQDGDVTNPRTVTVTSDMTFVATLAIDTFNLTVVANDSSYGSTTGTGTYAYGTQVEISATPNSHYHFTAWNDGVVTNPRTVTVTSDITYTSVFAIDTFTLTVESDDIETGSTEGSGTYAYGTPVNIYAYPESGYYFANWQDGNTSPTRTIVVTGNETYTAYFALEVITYNVILDVNDSDWGGVSGDGAYDDGQEYTIEAQPNEGYKFEYWEDGGGNPIYDNPYTDYINGGDVYYMAYFAVRNTYPIIYHSADEITEGQWIADNTNTTRNTYDTSTGEGTLYVYDDVTTIGGGQSKDYSPFYEDSSVTSVDLSDSSITEIDEYAFYGSSITEIYLPDTVTEIGDYAFADSSLTDLYIDSSVPPTLGTDVFDSSVTVHVPFEYLNEYESDWGSVVDVVTDDRVILYHNFNNTAVSGNWVTNNTDTTRNTIDSSGNGVLYLNDGVTTLGGGAGTSYSPFYTNSYIDSVDLQYSGLATLGTYAFRQTVISSLTIPASVTSVSDSIISQAPVTSLTVDASNNVYDSRNNCNAIIQTSTNTLVVGCNNSTIPNTVTSIGNNAFMYCTALQTITIPSSVTSIGYYAFYHCTSLTSITIPSSVTSIGDYAFQDCTGLTSLTFGNYSNVSLGQWCFSNCSSLTSIDFGTATNITFGSGVFRLCTSLTSVDFTDSSITTLGTSTFSGCSGLTSIDFEDTAITTIGDLCFANCTGLTSIDFSDSSVSSLGYCSFGGCSGLTQIADSSFGLITTIPEECFNSTGLTSFVLPNTITRIYERAFWNCVDLTSVTIPSSVLVIDEAAFDDCDSLMDVYVDSSVPATLGTNNFTTIGDTLHTPSLSAANAYKNATNWGTAFTYYLPEPQIRYNAGTQATGGWVNNNTDTTRNTYDVLTGDGVLYLNNDVSTLGPAYASDPTPTDSTPFYNKADLVSVDLSDSGLTTLANRAFYSCTGLTSIIFPDTLTTISGGLPYCSALTDLTLPEGLITISDSACISCTSLSSVTIPSTVTTVGNNSFQNCNNLKTVTCYATTPPTLGTNNFSVSGDTLYVPESAFNAYTSDSSWNGAFTNISVITDDKVISYKATTQASGNWVTTNTDTASNKFNNDRGVLYLNSGVTSIGGEDSTDNSPFYNKTDVVSIDITDTSINTIAKSAFMGCTSLTSISLDNGVLTEIAINGIRGCTILPSVTIPNTVTTLGDNVFRSNKAMTTANIPSGVTSIPSNAFNDCQSLASIDIPDTVTSIGVSAFEGCQRLKSITIGTGVTSIGRGAFHAYYPLEVDVYCKATTPPTLDSSNAFAFNYAQDTLHVPASSWDAYCNNSTWNGAFNHIKIIGETKYMAYKSTSQISNSNSWVANHTTTSKNKWNNTGKRGLLYVTNTSIGGGDSATYSPFYNSKTAIQNVDFSGAFPNVVIGSNVFQNCTSLVNVRLDPTVTQLRPSSFYGCTGLTKLLLPSTINEVANSATNGCSNLKTVWCYATSVPTLGTSNFTASSDTLYVPSASLNSYKNNSAWNSAFTTKSAFLEWW